MAHPGLKDQIYKNKVKNKLTSTYRKLKNFTLFGGHGELHYNNNNNSNDNNNNNIY